MKLVAEAGSTKIQWGIISKNNKHKFVTSGFNPNVSDKNYLRQLLVTGFPKEFNPGNIKRVIYYGSGCGSNSNKAEVERALANFFVHSEISIYTDLEAVGLAIFSNKKGYVGIMGTGSSFGYYQDCKIVEQSPSLGYLLGDEGAGAHIGKSFLTQLLSNQLPQKLSIDLQNEIGKPVAEIIKELYSSKVPNAYMAGYLPLIKAFLYETKIKGIVENSVQQFIDISILPLQKMHGNNTIGIVGGVAANFSELINSLFLKNNLPEPVLFNRAFDKLFSTIP